MNIGKLEVFNGKRVWVTDYRGLPQDQLVQIIKDTADVYLEQVKGEPPHSIPVLVNMNKMVASKEVVNALKDTGKRCSLYNGKTAIISNNNTQNMIINLIARVLPFPLKGFDTQEDAVEWLVEEDNE